MEVLGTTGLSPCVRGYPCCAVACAPICGSIPVCTGLPTRAAGDHRVAKVYPRVYGATSSRSDRRTPIRGLSPCVRGYHFSHPKGPWGERSIPVCTGLPRLPKHGRFSGWVYPRVYGATSWSLLGSTRSRGLSPCVRGYLVAKLEERAKEGSIPVCTGLPSSIQPCLLWTRVYPRVYGATCSICDRSCASRGLSPCVRGYRPRRSWRGRVAGSIPVCTGLPYPPRPQSPLRRVYPRVYGATAPPSRPFSNAAGLSPCVRGYPSSLCKLRRKHGSIPVCTGLPEKSAGCRLRPRVYPRVYGATCSSPSSTEQSGGLSPCVRGYLDSGSIASRLSGSIPVCTGLPLERRRSWVSVRVYPRVYGATQEGSSAKLTVEGLSPCVRGYLRHLDGVLRQRGSIPVCTGLPEGWPCVQCPSGVYPRVYGATNC